VDVDTDVTLNGGGSDTEDAAVDLTFSWAVTNNGPSGNVTLSNENTDTLTFQADAAGDYELTLTVTDTQGATDSDSVVVTVNATNTAPSATAPADTSVDVNTDVTLSGTGSDTEDAPGDLTFSWAVTNNGPSGNVTLTDENTDTLTFQADTAGDYELTLTVTDTGGLSDTDTVTVTVNATNTAPTATAPADTSVDANTDVTLNGGGSDAEDAPGDLTFSWAVTDNGPSGNVTLTNEDTDTLTFQADAAGDYELTLTVTDTQGATDSDSVVVTVNATNTAPTATAPADTSVDVNTDVTLSGAGSDTEDASGDLTFSWAVTNNGPSGNATLTDENTDTLTFQADTAGDYELTLTVTDTGGLSDTDTVTVTVNAVNTAPTATAPADTSVDVNTDVTLNGSGSDAEDASGALTYSWAVTNNGPSGNVTLSNEDTDTLTFQADAAGDYELTLTVTDTQGATDSDTVIVTVNAVGSADCLIISEYVEGSSNNKAIELYNCGGSDIDLTSYGMCLESNSTDTSNGDSCNTDLDLTGQLTSGDTLVICNSQFTDPNSACDFNSGITSFNGNDRFFIYEESTATTSFDYGVDSVVDFFGDFGDEANSTWAGVTYDRCDFTPHDGTGGFSADTLYTEFPEDTFSGLGVAPTEGCTP
jgi:hypothetical protein